MSVFAVQCQVAKQASAEVVCNHAELLSFFWKILEELLGVVSLCFILLLYGQFVFEI